jgi:hypothetical protein
METIKKPEIKRRRRGCLIVAAVPAAILLLGLIATAVANLLYPTPIPSAETSRLAEPEKALLAEAIHLRQMLGDDAWPGWGAADIPHIVYNQEYAFLVGYADPPPGWLKLPRRNALGGPWEEVPDDLFAGQVYYRQSLSQPDITPEAFTVLVGDRWVASLTTKEWLRVSLAEMFGAELPPLLNQIFPYGLAVKLFVNSSDFYVAGLLHESFHAYQGMTAPERLAAAETAVIRHGDRYPSDDTAVQEAWQVELDLLAQAVRADATEETAELVAQFLNQRAQRRALPLLDQEMVVYEQQREWLEGLAKYIELEIWRQAAAQPAYQPTPAILDDPDFHSYSRFDRQWSQEVDQMRRMSGSSGDGRFYYSGMAQAFLLDRLMPGWKSRALDEAVWLEELLAEAVAHR